MLMEIHSQCVMLIESIVLRNRHAHFLQVEICPVLGLLAELLVDPGHFGDATKPPDGAKCQEQVTRASFH